MFWGTFKFWNLLPRLKTPEIMWKLLKFEVRISYCLESGIKALNTEQFKIYNSDYFILNFAFVYRSLSWKSMLMYLNWKNLDTI